MALIDNLVSYYKFDNDSTDSHGSNDGTVNGATYDATGKINGCYSLDGVNDYISVPHTNDFNFSTNFTASCWFYKDSSEGAGAYNILNKCVVGSSGWMMYIDSTNSWKPFLFNYGLSGDTNIMSSIAVTEDSWNHVVVSYDGAKLRIYVNGTKTENTSTTGNMVSNTNVFEIAKYASSYLKCKIDEVGIWGRTLSDSEVLELYNDNSGYAYPFEVTPGTEDSKLFRYDGSSWVKVYQSEFKVNL